MRKVLPFLLFVSLSCGDSEPPDLDVEPEARSATYPTGPFGLTQGAVIANHEFDTADSGKLSLDDIRKDPSNRLLLLSTSAEWCSACIEEQRLFNDRHTQWSAQGLYILVAMFEDLSNQPADAADAEEWKRLHGLLYSVVADPEFSMDAYYDAQLTPMNMFIDLDTMEILSVKTGANIGAVDAIIQSRLK